MGIDITSPVPRDIEISQAARLQDIDEIAKQVGILPEELELYGSRKAKVNRSFNR